MHSLTLISALKNGRKHMKKMFTARFFFMHIFVLFYYFKYLATNETSSVIIFAAYVKKKYSDMT